MNLNDEFYKWKKERGEATEGMTTIFVNNNGNLTSEERWCTCIASTPNDVEIFCKEKNIPVPSEMSFIKS